MGYVCSTFLPCFFFFFIKKKVNVKNTHKKNKVLVLFAILLRHQEIKKYGNFILELCGMFHWETGYILLEICKKDLKYICLTTRKCNLTKNVIFLLNSLGSYHIVLMLIKKSRCLHRNINFNFCVLKIFPAAFLQHK